MCECFESLARGTVGMSMMGERGIFWSNSLFVNVILICIYSSMSQSGMTCIYSSMSQSGMTCIYSLVSQSGMTCIYSSMSQSGKTCIYSSMSQSGMTCIYENEWKVQQFSRPLTPA